MRDATSELAKAVELLQLLYLRPRRFAFVGPFLDLPPQFGICTCQLGGPLVDAALQLSIEEFELPGLPEEIGKHPYLGQQKFGNDWHKNVVNRPVAIPFDAI